MTVGPLGVDGVLRTNTILYCDEWAETVGFYRDTMGLEVSFANDWFVEFELIDGTHISVADASRATIEAGDGTGITLSWKICNLTTACEHLADLGVPVSSPTRRWGATTVFLHDPAGNRIELWTADV